MSMPRFNDIKSFSNKELAEAIVKMDKELFILRFKRVTKKSYKPHEIKHKRRQLAHLKTCLTLRTNLISKTPDNIGIEII